MSIHLEQISNSTIAYFSNNIFYGMFEKYGIYVDDVQRDINTFLYQVYFNREVELKIPMIETILSGILL